MERGQAASSPASSSGLTRGSKAARRFSTTLTKRLPRAKLASWLHRFTLSPIASTARLISARPLFRALVNVTKAMGGKWILGSSPRMTEGRQGAEGDGAARKSCDLEKFHPPISLHSPTSLILSSFRHRMGQRRLPQAGGELGAVSLNVRDIASGGAGGGGPYTSNETFPPMGCE
jgi:hypothetical protein